MTANVVWISAITQRPAMREAHLEPRELARLLLEAVAQLLRPAHRAAEQDAGDGQRLLDERRDVRERALLRRRDLAPLPADAPGQEDEERQQPEGEDREAPVEQEHGDDGRDHRRQVRDDRGGGRRDHGLDAADVVRDPRLDLAGARPREEGERQPLQVAVDRRAQVVHHLLADEVRHVRLHDAERAGRDRDPDHPGDEGGEQRDVLLRDGGVEDGSEEERRDDAEERGDADQAEDDAEPQTVALEESRDAPEIGAAHLGVGRALGPLARVERPPPSASPIPPCRHAPYRSTLTRGGRAPLPAESDVQDVQVRGPDRPAGPQLDPPVDALVQR